MLLRSNSPSVPTGPHVINARHSSKEGTRIKTVKIKADDARDLLEGISSAGFEYVTDVQTGESRWHELRQLIVRDEAGQLFASDYEDGLTENQEGDHWWYREFAEFYPVRQREVVVVEYERISA